MQKKGRMTLTRSTFPQQVDSFEELYDLPPSLVVQARRYQELKMLPMLSSTEQNELNGLTSQLARFIISPETFNKFADALVKVETFFAQEVTQFIEGKQVEWNGYVNNFNYVNEYSSLTQYKFQNMATYLGDLYLCLKDVKGINPTNVEYWKKITSKGEKGDTGLGAYYTGTYDPTKAYSLGEAVDFKGYLFYAKSAVLAGQTPDDKTKWFMWDRQVVSPTAPTIRQNGLIWLKVQ